MADILIRMEMPKHCIDCPCMVDKYGGDNCCLQSEEANEKITSWDDMKAGCPLHELPKHGDLIDRDAVGYTYALHTGVLMTCNRILDNLPAIVGADKELLEKAHKEFIEEASKNRAVKYEQEVKSMRDVALELRDEARQIKDGNAPVIVPSNKEVTE